MNDVSITIAFVAGMVSFLSPCVLPVLPGFLAYLSGSSLQENSLESRMSIFVNSIFFVLGFSVIFAVLGVLLNSVLNGVASEVQSWLARIGGVIVIFFGLYLTGLVKPAFLNREYKFEVKSKFKSRHFTSFVFGAAFAAGWTPCVGAALGAIIGLAASEPGTALYLLFAYSLGLGMPFLLVGLFAAQARAVIIRYAGALTYINIAFGVLLIALGVLVFTESLSLIANFEFLNKILLQ